MIGKKINNLTIIGISANTRKLVVRCVCGEEFETKKNELLKGQTISCATGLCNTKVQNLTGRRFGYLTVLRFDKQKTNSFDSHRRKSFWVCACDCGTEVSLHSAELLNGGVRSCKCMRGYLIAEKLSEGQSSNINLIFGAYKNRAKRKKFSFDLSRDQFIALIQNDCYYCGSAPLKVHKIGTKKISELPYNGIDRKDNSAGYTVNNSVTACYICNFVKREMHHDDFIALAKAISKIHKDDKNVEQCS